MFKSFGKRNDSKDLWIGIILSAILLCVYAVQLSVPVISDETTTMANAAWLTNRDWSWMIAALGGYYYRFAQALMTVPFFYWLDNPEMIYRLSMVLQALIQVSIIPVVYTIGKKHLKIKSDKINVLLSMAVCLVPSMALYVFYYRGDYLLGVLPWYSLLSLLETTEVNQKNGRKKQIVHSLLMAIYCVLAYMAHTRGIVLTIAIIISAILAQIFWKKSSLHWPVFLGSLGVLALVDNKITTVLKGALYTISGLNSNAIESTDMGHYFNIFSLKAIKDLVLLCLSWLYTLVTTTQGLVLIGMLVAIIFLVKTCLGKRMVAMDNEKVVFLFSLLVFLGYYAVGALFFKGTYLALRTGELEKRVDRLLYDRYAICGAGMMVFVGLYTICCKKEWFKWKEKISTLAIYAVILIIFFCKILPIATRYKGYIYNTITLNTFNSVNNPAKILSGEYYSKDGLVLATIFGLALMVMVFLFSSIKEKWMPYAVLFLIVFSDVILIHVNYEKIRKASNDYVIEATEDIVDFMQTFEAEVIEEYPYILKGGLSGVKIQFYQSQLMSYKMFGKKQVEELGIDNYFIISNHDDINLTWYEDDYYLFESFDYKSAEYDIVYVKGHQLMKYMESLGYEMEKYIPEVDCFSAVY